MNEAKMKIKDLVATYIRTSPKEYEAVKSVVLSKRDGLKNKFADMSKDSDVIERELYEIPETLFTIFQFNLSGDESEWLRSKQGAHWFCREFPEFRITHSV